MARNKYILDDYSEMSDEISVLYVITNYDIFEFILKCKEIMCVSFYLKNQFIKNIQTMHAGWPIYFWTDETLKTNLYLIPNQSHPILTPQKSADLFASGSSRVQYAWLMSDKKNINYFIILQGNNSDALKNSFLLWNNQKTGCILMEGDKSYHWEKIICF